MAKSDAATPEEYLARQPPDRRAALAAVRDVVNRHLPPGYEEAMQYGAITWRVPLSRLAQTYNGQPLAMASLAAQKSHLAIYLMQIYAPDAAARFAEEYRKAGRRLDMGRACVRFRTLEDLPLDLIGRTIASVGVDEFVDLYMATRPQASRAKESVRRRKPRGGRGARDRQGSLATRGRKRL
jgi:uncharacterized protein YdhG (YjbR/CyaY superfamily)